MVAGKKYEVSTLLWDGNKSIKTCSKKLQKVIKTCLNSNSHLRYSTIEILRKKLIAIVNKTNTISKSIKSSEPVQIAISGAQSRIGATHLSLLITSFLKQYSLKSIYIEKNNSNHVHKILEKEKNIKDNSGIYTLNGISYLPSYEIKLPIDLNQYHFHIIDFGILTPNNINEFLEADICACILGAKKWELEYSRKTIKMLCDKEKIKYLFNFLDSNDYLEVTKELDLPCYRIPYEPNVFAKKYNKNTVDFIEDILYH